MDTSRRSLKGELITISATQSIPEKMKRTRIKLKEEIRGRVYLRVIHGAAEHLWRKVSYEVGVKSAVELNVRLTEQLHSMYTGGF